MMRLLLAALLLLGAASAQEPVKSSTGGPRIRVEPQSFDFGDALPPEVQAQEDRLRAEIAAKQEGN